MEQFPFYSEFGNTFYGWYPSKPETLQVIELGLRVSYSLRKDDVENLMHDYNRGYWS